MLPRDENTIDPNQQKLRLAGDVAVWPVRERGELVYRLEIPSLHKFYRVGYEEYVLISLLDGQTTLPQACGLAAAKRKHRAPTTQQAVEIAQWLVQNELAHPSGSPAPVRQLTQKRSQEKTLGWLSKLNPFWMKIPLARSSPKRPTSLVDSAADGLKFLFSTWAVCLGCLVIFAGLLGLIANWSEIVSTATSVVSPSNWIWLLLTWVMLKVIHEWGHAAACRWHGGNISEAGIVLVLFAPLAYVDVSSCWRINSRWRRIGISAAGMYVEWIIAAIGILLLSQTDSPSTAQVLQNLIFAAGISTLLFNANVLMRFDGYFILADLIDVPNFYAESMSELRRLIKRHAFGLSVPPGNFVGWRIATLRFYGVAAIIWKVLICFTLGMAAATMFSGAGLVLSFLGAAMWLGNPAKQFALFLRQTSSRDLACCVRGCGVLSITTAMAFAVIFFAPMPTSVRTPAVVRFVPDSIVRSAADGFIRRVHVSDQANVNQGDVLVELENPELRQRLVSLETQLAQNTIHRRGAQQASDASLGQVLRERADSLNKQIASVQTQVDALRLVANRSGQVHARNLKQRVGTMVQDGDELFTIAQDHQKEILAIVHQDHVRVARRSVGKSVPLRTASFRKIAGTVDLVEPLAKVHLDAPSLSAIHGGPLAVRPRSSQNDSDARHGQLLQPHFSSRISIDPQTARSLPAGMRLNASMGYRTDSIATRLRVAITRLWQAKSTKQ
jgi:putative peptide zinc metalloprotease protein